MREIKFRAWDEHNKVMHNNFQFIRSGTKDGDWIIFISDTNPFKNPSPYATQQLKITQYTGIKDEDGAEIYEGDIAVTEGDTNQERYIVEFRVSGFHLCPVKTKSHIRIISNLDELKIIGNAYENPELLEAKLGSDTKLGSNIGMCDMARIRDPLVIQSDESKKGKDI